MPSTLTNRLKRLLKHPRIIRCLHIGHHESDQISIDYERIRKLIATSRHLRNASYRYSKINNFVEPSGCCQVDLVSDFQRISSLTLYCARYLRVAQRNSIDISFQSGNTRYIYGSSYFRLEISSSHPANVGRISHVHSCQH